MVCERFREISALSLAMTRVSDNDNMIEKEPAREENEDEEDRETTHIDLR